MKTNLLSLLMATIIVCVAMVSCSDEEGGGATIPLVEHQNITLGWAKGTMNNPGYLSLSMGEGKIKAFQTVAANDEATQGLVDVVFPISYGPDFYAAAPTNSYAGLSLCKNWIRKNGTLLEIMPEEFNLTTFEKLKTFSQLKALASERSDYLNESDLLLPGDGDNNFCILVKTYNGTLAIIYVTKIQGNVNDTQAKITTRIKVAPKTVYNQ